MDIQFLQAIPDLADVPEDQLQWFLDAGELHHYEVGEYLFQKGTPTEHLHIIVSGEFRLSLPQKDGVQLMGDMVPGEITGVLPYSRMKAATGFGEAKVKSSVFCLHRSQFKAMIRDHYELTAAFVHKMTSRVRSFTSFQLQNEKLVSLGKLSAGLAHELNNPASAIVRSAKALQEHLQLVPENFKQVMKIQATEEQIDAVNQLLFSRIGSGTRPELSLMERTEAEDDMADWLEDHGFEDGYEVAEPMVDFGFTPDDFEVVTEQIPAEAFPAVIKWIDDNLTTDKMVGEIEEAASRIAELVQSVKGYTHMDRANAIQAVDLHPGLKSTLTMLGHKIKQNQVQIEQNFDPELNPVEGSPGELNQVFTNLIDNALDAMEGKGGTLSLWTRNDGPYVKLDIQDSGTGISEEDIKSIFDPFFTTKEMGKGTGMGLDLVQKIVTRHKGIIEVESEPGKTVFSVCFPAQKTN